MRSNQDTKHKTRHKINFQDIFYLKEGALGFSVLRIWPIFGSVFRFSFSYKLRFFGFGVSCNIAIWCYLQYSLWVLVFGFCKHAMRAVFRILLPNPFYGFSGFGKEVTPCSHANTNSKDHLQLQECMRSRRNCCQAARRKCVG